MQLGPAPHRTARENVDEPDNSQGVRNPDILGDAQVGRCEKLP